MLSIGVVARQTGIEISTLRKWESRYGFPQPVRAKSGQRKYPASDVLALLQVARRVAGGERVGHVIQDLLAVGKHFPEPTGASQVGPDPSQCFDTALAAVRDSDLLALRLSLEQARSRGTLLDFVEKFAAPLTIAVGDGWARGEISVYAEHIYSALLESLLAREFVEPRLGADPLVLLTTLAGEKHMLGLSMIHALLGEAGVPCIRMFSDLPNSEIVAACQITGFRAVGVSVSANFPPRLLRSEVFDLRKRLDPDVALWLGGEGVDCLRQLPEGTRIFSSLQELIDTARLLTPQPGTRGPGGKGN